MSNPNARILTCSEVAYYSDPCEQPSLSYSIASELIRKSPLHAWYLHPRLGGGGKPETRAMHLGQVFDALLLGGSEKLVVLDYDDYRTKQARQHRDDLMRQRLIPILAYQLAEAKPIAEMMAQRLAALGIKFSGENQVAIEWTEESSLGPVICRARLDHFIRDTLMIYDLKSVECAEPGKATHNIVSYGLDIQAAAYSRAVAAMIPGSDGRVQFVDLFCETSMPVAVSPIRFTGGLLQLGELRWKRAVETWARCLRDNDWPGYARGIIDGQVPEWALEREMEISYAANV